MATEIGSKQRVTRKAVLRSGGAVVGAAALFGVAPPALAAGGAKGALTFDVAIDGRTMRINRRDPTLSNQLPMRGDTFIIGAKIYPGGTFDHGFSGPDQRGSIGTYTNQATVYNDFSSGKAPLVVSTHFWQFDNGDVLITQGLEGGMMHGVHCVVGGFGAYAGARGYVKEQRMKKDNNSLLDLGPMKVRGANFRYVFTLMQ